MIVLKTQTELETMKLACKISADALNVAEEMIKPDITTKEIDRKMYEYIKKCGATPSFLGYMDYPASACISVNDVVIHGIPSGYRLKHGDIVSIDVGAYYKGFHGDNAYTFIVGDTTDEIKSLLKETENSLYKGIEQAIVGNRVGDISNAIETHVSQFGYGIVRQFVGHGVGKKLHEEPEVPNFGRPGRGPRLVEGMTLAIEPMINLKGDAVKVMDDGWTTKTVSGTASAHFEHTIAITRNGPVILTKR